MFSPGQRFSSTVTLTLESVSAFARSIGDQNPIHYDAAAAAEFGGQVASGPHTMSLLMGLAATHFSRQGSMLGVEFHFRFLKPVLATETLTLEWEIKSVDPHKRGHMIGLRGRVLAAGDLAVEADGKVLVTPNSPAP